MKANLLTILMLLLFSTSAWGASSETATLTFTKACGGSGTDDKSNSWTITSDASESTFDSNRGIHYGTGSKAVSYVQLTTSGITATITKIVVNAAGGSSPKINVTVGGNAFGTEQSAASSASDYEFTGSGKGAIVVRVSQTSAKQAIYVKSVAVTYTTSSCTETQTITFEGGASHTIDVNDDFSIPYSVSPTPSGDRIVTFTSSNTSIATVTSAGLVHGVAKGSANITVKVAGDNTYCEQSETYAITVNNVSYDVTWTSNGETIKSEKIEGGTKPTSLPDAPTPPTGKTFMGWTKNGVTDPTTAPTDMFTTAAEIQDKVNSATEYKAVFATQSGDNTKFAKLKSIGLSDGQKVVIVNNTVTNALSSTALEGSEGYLTAKSVTIDEDELTTDESSVVWTVELVGNNTNSFRLKQGANYLYASSNSYSHLFAGSTQNTWSLSTTATTNAYLFTNTSNYRFLLNNNNYTSASNSTTTNVYRHFVFVQQVSYTGYTTSVGEKVAKPTFSIENGTHFKDGQSLSVELTCATDGAEIRYTADGNDPTSESSLYNGAISITKKTTIKAIGIKQGVSNSQIASATYYCDYIATFSVPEGKTAPASIEGSTIIMPAAPVEKCNGYTFQGWARTTKSGTSTTPTDMTAAGGEYEMDKTRTFYAVYQNSDDSKYYTSFTCLTPTLSAPPALVIGKSKIGQTRVVNINLTGSNIIGTTTLAITGTNADKFAVSPTSIDAPDGGTLAQVLSISYTPTAKQEDNATLTISSTDAAPIEVALSGEGTNMTFRRYLTKCKPTVFFDVNDVVEHYAEIDNDGHVPAYTPVGTCSDKHFIGWSETQVDELQQSQPTLINFATKVFEPSDPAAGITVYAVFASPNGGKIGEEQSVTDVFTSYSIVSTYQNTDPRTYGRWSVINGGVSSISDVQSKMGKQAIVLQRNNNSVNASMTAYVQGFEGISAQIATKNTVSYKIVYSTNNGQTWNTLLPSTDHGDYRSKTFVSPEKLTTPVDALVRIEVTNADGYGSNYRIYVDDVTIYTKPRTYWYSDYSTNCDKALSATLTYDANGGTPTPTGSGEMGSDVTLADASSTSMECYTLTGWQVQDADIPEEGENIYFFAPGDKYLLNHDVTLVAQWEKDLLTPAATLVFHKGYNNTEEVVVNCHSTAGDIEAIRPECAAGEGFEFVGWTRTQLPAEGQEEKPELFNIAKEITSISAETIHLYPVWKGGELTGTDYIVGATGNYVIAAEVSDGIWVAIPNAPVINEKGKISGDTIKVGTTDGGVKYVLEGDAEGYTWTISNNDGKGQRFFDGTYYIYPTGGGSGSSSNISRGKTGDAVSNYGWTVSHNTYWEIASTDGTTTPATVNTKGLIYRTTDGYGFGQYTVGSVSATYKEVRILPIYSYDGKYMPTPECRSIINAESISGLVSIKDATIKTTGRLNITKMYGPAMAGNITGDDATKFAVTFGEKYTESDCEYMDYTVSYTPTAVGETATATITFDDGSGNTWTAESEGQHPSITVRGKAVPSTFVIAAQVNGKYIALPENTTSSAGPVDGTAIEVGRVGGIMTAIIEKASLNYTMTETAGEGLYQHLSSHSAPFYANASGLRSATGATATFYDWIIALNDDGSVRMKANQGTTNPVTYNSTSGKFVTTVGESTSGDNYFRDLYLLPSVTESGDEMDIVDWSTDGSNITSLTINMNGYTTTGIEAALNGAAEMTALSDVNFSGDQPSAGDATFAVNGTMTSGDLVRLQIQWDSKAGEDVSDRFYRVPYIYAGEDATISSELTPYDIIVVKSGKATIAANTTAHNVYVYPGAELVIDDGATLTCDNLYLRTRPFSAAIFQNNGTLTCGQVYYTRYTADKSAYYHITLPFASTIADMRLTTGQKMAYGTKWQLKEYDSQRRADEGKASGHWVVVNGEQMQACVGYQMLSGSAKYREYCFPVAYEKVALGAKVAVTAYTGAAAEGDAMNGGWNHIGLPYTGKYTTSYDDPSEGLKLAVLDNDNVNFYQTMPKEINPAQPFYYQASATGDLVFGEKTIEPKKAVPAYLAARKAEEPARTQWIQLFLTDSNGKRDEANIFSSPSKFTDDYEIGYDVGKMTGDGSRVQLCISIPCGDMAFAAIPDATAEDMIPLTVNMPQSGKYVFSMAENNYLNRLEHVYIIDENDGSIRDLKTQTYEVELSQSGEFRNRFFLNCVFRQSTPTDVTQLVGENGMNGPEKIIYNEHFYIIDSHTVYDGTGSRVK